MPKHFARVLLCLGLAFALPGCSSSTEPVKTPDSITVDQTDPVLVAGGTLQLTARLTNRAGDTFPNSVISYSTTSPLVTVSSTGLITSVGPVGTFTVTLTSSGISKTVNGRVTAGPASRLSIVSGNNVANKSAGSVSDTLIVAVTDAFQNPVAGATVGWSVTAGGGHVNSATSTSSTDGRAAMLLVLGTTVGTNTVVAALGSSTVTFSVTSVAGAVTQVTIAPTAPQVLVGSTITLVATARDANGNVNSSQAATWTSSDAATASVGASTGVVSGVRTGTATITATVGGVSATTTVTVNGVVHSVTLSPSPAAVTVGATLQVSAAVSADAGVSTSVTWTSSNTAVASVSSSGLVSGISAGSATITATSVATPSVSGSTNVTVSAASSPGTLSGSVYNAVSGAALAGATVAVNQNGTAVTTVTTRADGGFTTAQLPGGSYSVVVSSSGFVTATITTIRINGNTFAEAVPLVPASTATGAITGTIVNATTNAALTVPATVELRAGMNATTGPALQTATATGTYSFSNVAAGTYTVVARASGFVDASRTGISVGSTTTSNQNVFISPVSSSGTVRAILTWRDTPSDLDFHLTGPVTGSTSRFHVWYASKGDCTASPFACLDVDVVTGRGPETLTISQQASGVYRFSVQNYTDAGDGSNATSTTLASSGARVDLYINNVLSQSFAVPGGAGSLWTVFELNGTTVTPINTITAGPPPVGQDGPTASRAAAHSDATLIYEGVRKNLKLFHR